MYYGRFERKIDEKNRLILPADLVKLLGNTFYLTIGLDGIVEIRSSDEFESFTDVFINQSILDKDARTLKRNILGNSQKIDLDKNNRFTIPKQFLDKATIQKREVILNCSGDCIELWSAEQFKKYDESISDTDIVSAAQKLAERNKDGK